MNFLLQSLSRSHKVFKLAPGTYCLGRSLECDLVVSHETVSRHHAEITVGETGVQLRDLGSRNGTFVGGKRISECAVNPGDFLCFGKVSFQFCVPEWEADKLRSEDETASVGDADNRVEIGSRRLSPGQLRVLGLVLNGLSEKEIGRQLHLSHHTVHHHVQAIYRILEVHSKAELLVRYARKAGE